MVRNTFWKIHVKQNPDGETSLDGECKHILFFYEHIKQLYFCLMFLDAIVMNMECSSFMNMIMKNNIKNCLKVLTFCIFASTVFSD